MIQMLRKVQVLFIVFLPIVLMTSTAFADKIIGSDGTDWQSWTTTELNQNGKPYWDNTSGDGSKKNIGYCLTGTGNCTLDTSPGTLAFWGKSDGKADPNFYFSKTADSSHNFTLELELAGYRDRNVFGWYEYDPIKDKIGTKHIIFYGPDNPEKSVDFIMSENYGFYLYVGNTDKTYYTQSEFNTDDIDNQHFAIFRDNNIFWIAMEDLSFRNSDKDYNDMVVRDPIPTPEPSTLFLLGAGFVGVGLLRKRFKK